MAVENNHLGIRRRKFNLIQVPPLLFRPSKSDTIILEEILHETEPTCFVDGFIPDVKGLLKISNKQANIKHSRWWKWQTRFQLRTS